MPPLRYSHQTVRIGSHSIHLRTLLDNQQFDDPDGQAAQLGISSANWPLFGVLWPAGEVLARHMETHEIIGLRILEVGCGIGLASLLLNQRAADISATDHHPAVAEFLDHNVKLNFDKQIPFLRADWQDGASSLGKFDLIIGSDLLYEPNHAALLSQFVDQHAQPTCEVIIVDPGRGNTGRFSRHMAAYGYAASQSRPTYDQLLRPFTGRVLLFSRSTGATEPLS